jgi:hypothetical protein
MEYIKGYGCDFKVYRKTKSKNIISISLWKKNLGYVLNLSTGILWWINNMDLLFPNWNLRLYIDESITKLIKTDEKKQISDINLWNEILEQIKKKPNIELWIYQCPWGFEDSKCELKCFHATTFGSIVRYHPLEDSYVEYAVMFNLELLASQNLVNKVFNWLNSKKVFLIFTIYMTNYTCAGYPEVCNMLGLSQNERTLLAGLFGIDCIQYKKLVPIQHQITYKNIYNMMLGIDAKYKTSDKFRYGIDEVIITKLLKKYITDKMNTYYINVYWSASDIQYMFPENEQKYYGVLLTNNYNQNNNYNNIINNNQELSKNIQININNKIKYVFPITKIYEEMNDLLNFDHIQEIKSYIHSKSEIIMDLFENYYINFNKLYINSYNVTDLLNSKFINDGLCDMNEYKLVLQKKINIFKKIIDKYFLQNDVKYTNDEDEEMEITLSQLSDDETNVEKINEKIKMLEMTIVNINEYIKTITNMIQINTNKIMIMEKHFIDIIGKKFNYELPVIKELFKICVWLKFQEINIDDKLNYILQKNQIIDEYNHKHIYNISTYNINLNKNMLTNIQNINNIESEELIFLFRLYIILRKSICWMTDLPGFTFKTKTGVLSDLQKQQYEAVIFNSQKGGVDYYSKYLKYKTKYLQICRNN